MWGGDPTHQGLQLTKGAMGEAPRVRWSDTSSDGVSKHRTVIEAGAFVGGSCVLVAPVTIGEGAYIAAGSVITEDVPRDSLAVARNRQSVKEDWQRPQPGSEE